jgi:hypothetical protein
VLRLVFGMILGLALASGASWLYLQKSKDCLSRCGNGTHCFNGRCIATGPATSVSNAPIPARGKRKRHGGPGGEGAQPELKLSPGDERISNAGDALGRPEHIDLSEGGSERELTQDDLDAVFRPAQAQISRCITDAVGDYPLETGKVEVAFRVERSGAVKKVRLEAPQLLMRRGLYNCVRPIVLGLRFPASGGANVVTYPFALQ